jgi:hypothetical protein
MRKLIPNNITVSEQFVILTNFMTIVSKWDKGQFPCNVDKLLEDSGVKCTHLGPRRRHRLGGFEVVDEKKYLFFVLKWS